MQELACAKVIEALERGEIKAGVAALRLQISTRHFLRLRKQFAESGVMGLVSGRRGKPSNNQLVPGLALSALQIVREQYADFGPTLACEMLRERHGIELSKETLRRLMTHAGLWTPRSTRGTALHQPRERRPCLGELVQIDGSRHHWFEQRGLPCTVLVYVDDATGRILHLHFAETESTISYFEATRAYLQRHGKPQAFYADRAAVFRSAAENKLAPTQFQRALDELGITLICANSPQAKGRVERANRTLQDRLVKALRLDEIDSIEAANAWVGQFIERYNARFAVSPSSDLDQHQPLLPTDDLARILALRDSRKLSAKLTLQHEGWQYLLNDEPTLRALIGQSISIHTYADGRVELCANGQILQHAARKLPKRAGPIDADSKTVNHRVDKLQAKRKSSTRPERHNMPGAVVTAGVKAAKQASAQKRTTSS